MDAAGVFCMVIFPFAGFTAEAVFNMGIGWRRGTLGRALKLPFGTRTRVTG